MTRLFLYLLSLSVISSCTITKRQHLPGYHISFRTHYTASAEAQENVKENDQQEPATTDLPAIRTAETIRQEFAAETVQSARETSTTPSENRLTANSDELVNELLPTVTETKHESATAEHHVRNEKVLQKPKIKQGWKIFWLTLLAIVLFAAFLYAGARWPVAYVIWFGLSAILALFKISSSADGGTFVERIPVVLAFLGLAGFYLWIDFLLLPFWSAIYLQLALYGILGLIGLIIYLIYKKRASKMEKQ